MCSGRPHALTRRCKNEKSSEANFPTLVLRGIDRHLPRCRQKTGQVTCSCAIASSPEARQLLDASPMLFAGQANPTTEYVRYSHGCCKWVDSESSTRPQM